MKLEMSDMPSFPWGDVKVLKKPHAGDLPGLAGFVSQRYSGQDVCIQVIFERGLDSKAWWVWDPERGGHVQVFVPRTEDALAFNSGLASRFHSGHELYLALWRFLIVEMRCSLLGGDGAFCLIPTRALMPDPEERQPPREVSLALTRSNCLT